MIMMLVNGDDDVGLVMMMMMTMTLMMMAMTVLVTVPKVSCKWETGQEAPTSKCHHLRSRFVKSAMGVSNGVWGYLLKIKWKSSSRFDVRKKMTKLPCFFLANLANA